MEDLRKDSKARYPNSGKVLDLASYLDKYALQSATKTLTY